MNDFIHGPQLSHPPDGPGGLLSQDKPLNHGMNDAVSSVDLQCCLLSYAIVSVTYLYMNSISLYNLIGLNYSYVCLLFIYC